MSMFDIHLNGDYSGGGSTLRADLASPDAGKGAELVARLQADSMFDLVSLHVPTTDGFGVELRAFYSSTDAGGGRFYWDANRNKASANGGTIIDPTTIGTLSSTSLGTFLDVQGTGVGTGCWVRLERSSVNVEWFGAKFDGSTNDSAPINAAINLVASRNGGKVLCPPRRGRCNITLKTGVYLVGEGFEISSAAATRGTILQAAVSGIVVDIEPGTCCGIIDLNVQGLGSVAASTGVRMINVSRGLIRNVFFNGFTDEAVLLNYECGACTITDIVIQNTLLNRTRTSKAGALDISGSDHWIARAEVTTSQSALSGDDLFLCAIAIRGSTAMLDSVIGEISDIGFYYAPNASSNKATNCRADLNFGIGWDINSANNSFAGCFAFRNSRGESNTYSGFVLAASSAGNMFSACHSSSLYVDSWRQKYGYDDLFNGAANRRNQYAACSGVLNETALYSMVGYLGSSPNLPSYPVRATDGDTTPSVDESELLVLAAYVTSTTITNFDDGIGAQRLVVIGNSNVTLQHGSTLKLKGGVNKTLINDHAYLFQRYNGVWYEVASE